MITQTMVDKLMQLAQDRHPGEPIESIGINHILGHVCLWYHHGSCRSTKIVRLPSQEDTDETSKAHE